MSELQSLSSHTSSASSSGSEVDLKDDHRVEQLLVEDETIDPSEILSTHLPHRSLLGRFQQTFCISLWKMGHPKRQHPSSGIHGTGYCWSCDAWLDEGGRL